MNGKREIFWRSVQLFALVMIAELTIYFRVEIMSFLPSSFPEWFPLFLTAFLALLVSAIFWYETDRNETVKGQFIEIATHKFRTPLSVIGWSADALETEIPLGARREEVKKIRNSVEKLREIIDTFLGVTAVNESVFYHFDPVDFRSIVEASLKESLKKEMEEKGIKLIVDLPARMPTIYADNRRVEFVIKNLIENAVRYTGKNGEISISAKVYPESLIFSVKDTGIGIASEEMRNIFSSFYRSKAAKLKDTEGMGLGLFVSEKIMGKHGGRIWVESPGLGKGSTFYIQFRIDKYKQVVA